MFKVTPDPIYVSAPVYPRRQRGYVVETHCDPDERRKLYRAVHRIKLLLNRKVTHSFSVPTDTGFDLHLFAAYRATRYITLDDVYDETLTIIRKFQDLQYGDEGEGDRVIHDVVPSLESAKRELMGEIPPHRRTSK